MRKHWDLRSKYRSLLDCKWTFRQWTGLCSLYHWSIVDGVGLQDEEIACILCNVHAKQPGQTNDFLLVYSTIDWTSEPGLGWIYCAFTIYWWSIKIYHFGLITSMQSRVPNPVIFVHKCELTLPYGSLSNWDFSGICNCPLYDQYSYAWVIRTVGWGEYSTAGGEDGTRLSVEWVTGAK